MIEVRAYFSDHHIGSSHELARIIGRDWPTIKVTHRNATQTVSYPAKHSESCSACIFEIEKLQTGEWYIGRHRAK